ncbi:metal-dependent hydrolase [Candidatus Woesearchaeota archaeon]|nr:metal-dependent hydrolase [Candidatus Woesearchaeota archaeon]
MMFITHLAFGFLTSLLAIKLFQVPNQIIFILAVIAGAILPDIDYMSSKIGSKVRLLSFILEMIFGHRGLMHTIYVPIIAFIAFSIFGYQLIGFAFMIGFTSHLLIDCLNIKGISFFRPFNKLHLQGFIKTGGILEYALLAVIIVLIVLMIDTIL